MSVGMVGIGRLFGNGKTEKTTRSVRRSEREWVASAIMALLLPKNPAEYFRPVRKN
ncbi:hypothetical protein [Aminivibrio sp.]|uniref:hypothetical protein n=1 Tax=Aminivibrio sp. TaxID=1872489 RepID=UPI00345E714A